ncbi:MAG: 1-acyl-sn-glycerol-3-phosphate acyltransferase [Myxococcota bacterium]|nr:1-acyl-sn-glycerol-3-phosphate acyltransferase [Myxococcota bacterium]
MKPEHKDIVRAELLQRLLGQHQSSPSSIEATIFDTLYEERKRLEGITDPVRAAKESAFYDALHQRTLRGSEREHLDVLRTLISAFFEEVLGHFDPRVYALATRALPVALSGLLRTLSPIRLLEAIAGESAEGVPPLEAGAPSEPRTSAARARNGLVQQLVLSGQVAQLQALAQRGTVILTPTHSSNLDSVLIGFALHLMQLPPFIYGAGLNLFKSPLVGFFMHRLGAYRVDRRKTATLYKEVLKSYSGLSLEMGYHNLFFPGGTRSRSGMVETRLKLGLLGTGLDAYIHNLIAERARPDVFIVPCTLNYELVLEAETLIRDHLAEHGKSRFIIDDDEFSKPKRIFDFLRRLFALESRIELVIGEPLDPFGHRVDAEGQSMDPRGRPIDRRRYVWTRGRPCHSPQRDREYTRELASSIVSSFHRNTVLQSTQVVSAALFEHLRSLNPELDLYRLLRTGGSSPRIPLIDFYPRLESLLERCNSLAERGGVRLDQTLCQGDPIAVLNTALSHFQGYHERLAVRRVGEQLEHIDRQLMLFYAHRLRAFDLLPSQSWK